MDPFESFPSELCLAIFERLYPRQKKDMIRLTHASPVMFREYSLSRKLRLARLFVTDKLSDGLINDAMAVALFPPPRAASLDDYVDAAERHMAKWGAQTLPNPVRENNLDGILMLERIYRQLRVFVEDYCAKATAEFPPRAYVCLPNFNSSESQLLFKGQKIDNGFDIDTLTTSESHRILKAFLWYELNRKIDQVYRASDEEFQLPFHVGFEARMRLIEPWRDRFNAVPVWEREAVRCVFGYIEDLYKALFAQVFDEWLPHPPTCATPPLGAKKHSRFGLLFPDNIVFGGLYWYSCEAFDHNGGLKQLSNPFAGLDPITHILGAVSAQQNGFSRFKKWCHDSHEAYPRANATTPRWRNPYLCIDRLAAPQKTCLFRYRQHPWDQGPGMCRILQSRLPEKTPRDPQRQWKVDRLHHKMFRQRAWVFFDDERLYPGRDIETHFPELEELQRQRMLMGRKEYRATNRLQAQRRSQKWHDVFDELSPAAVVEEEDSDESFEIVEERTELPRFFDDRAAKGLIPFWRGHPLIGRR